MKAIYLFPKILLLSLFVLVSCNKDDDTNPTNPDDFFRLEAYQVAVKPSQRMVQILFQVTDYQGDGVSDLTIEDFIVTENGGRIDSEADLKIDQGAIPFALKTVLLLDLTRSVEDFVGQIKSAAIALVNKKIENQEIAIYAFDTKAYLVQDFTTDQNTLIEAIEGLPESDLVNSTNLYGAIIEMADLWVDSYSIDNIEDGSLVVFTDGRHNATPAITLADAQAAMAGKKVYVAALNGPDLDEASLKTLAGRSDRYFKADNIASLEDMFLDIQQEIQNLSRSIYYMFYQSPISDPTARENELNVQIKNNSNPDEDRRILEMFSSEGFGN